MLDWRACFLDWDAVDWTVLLSLNEPQSTLEIRAFIVLIKRGVGNLRHHAFPIFLEHFEMAVNLLQLLHAKI